MTRNKFAEAVTQRVEAAMTLGQKVTGDWSWLKPIIEDLIEQLIEQCFPSETIFLARVPVRRRLLEWRLENRCWFAIRREVPLGERQVVANEMVLAIMQTTLDCTTEELTAMYRERA